MVFFRNGGSFVKLVKMLVQYNIFFILLGNIRRFQRKRIPFDYFLFILQTKLFLNLTNLS